MLTVDHQKPTRFPLTVALRAMTAKAVSQLVLTEPGFPVDLCGVTELHAAFREESRTSLL
jgi:hypothetical protein